MTLDQEVFFLSSVYFFYFYQETLGKLLQPTSAAIAEVQVEENNQN
jgi:hypothetical protein